MTLIFLFAGILAASSAIMAVMYIPPLSINENSIREEKLQDLNSWLSRLNDKDRFSGSVLLAKGDKILFSKSYGFQDIAETKSLAENSSFNLASVSKQFTAMAIVLLKYQEKLAYKDSITKYIPELNLYKEVTIENLLHHTSGIPDYISIASINWDESEILKTSDVIAILKDNKELKFSPGEKYDYSNSGYILLAEIVARASGVTFSEFMKNNVFIPAEMNYTTVFNLLSEDEPENRVFGFKKNHWIFGRKKQVKDLNYFDGVVGDGGIYSSAKDLYQWSQAITKEKVVPQEEYDLAFESGRLRDGSKTGYGYGWFIKGEGIVEHAGGWQGFASYIYRDVSTDSLIVVLDNSSNIFRVTSHGFRINSICLNLQKLMNEID